MVECSLRSNILNGKGGIHHIIHRIIAHSPPRFLKMTVFKSLTLFWGSDHLAEGLDMGGRRGFSMRVVRAK